MLGAGALGWPRGGFRMGNMCIPVVDSWWYMAKPTQYCEVKKKRKRKKNIKVKKIKKVSKYL